MNLVVFEIRFWPFEPCTLNCKQRNMTLTFVKSAVIFLLEWNHNTDFCCVWLRHLSPLLFIYPLFFSICSKYDCFKSTTSLLVIINSLLM